MDRKIERCVIFVLQGSKETHQGKVAPRRRVRDGDRHCIQGHSTSGSMEDERQDSALGNHMEGLNADEPRCLLGYQWQRRDRNNNVPRHDSLSDVESYGRTSSFCPRSPSCGPPN